MKVHRITSLRIKVSFLLLCFAFTLIFGSVKPARAAGASLYLSPSTGTYVIGGKFSVSVKVNTGDQVVNAAEGVISFDNSLLEVTGVSKGGSVFSLWTVEPTFSNSAGTINFGGGIPRPGYSGAAGHICTVSFKAKKAGNAQVRFSSGAVLANDGKGTNVLASMGSASFTVSPQVTAPETTEKKEPTPAKEAEKRELEYNKPVITSPTHPDQNSWYNNNQVIFKWELPEGVTDVSISFDRQESSDPGSVSDGLLSEKEYKDIGDGAWYLHLKFRDSVRWSTVGHYKVMIDTVPPDPFKAEIEYMGPGEWPKLHFDAEDDLSGIKHYEIIIGSFEEHTHIVSADKDSYQVSELKVGEHVALVSAVDNAGNGTHAKIEFTIEPIEAPVITDYAREIKSSDKFFMSGTSLADVSINVFIEKDDKTIITDIVRSDRNGNWFYISQKILGNGRYTAWAEAVNDKGIKSEYSNKVSFLVSPPIFARFGSWVINYFTVFVSLLFMVIVIILLILLLAAVIRKKLKKETSEIEDVLRKNFRELQNTIDEDLEELEKARGKAGYHKEKDRIEEQLKNNIKQSEKRIIKEIEDVEDILK